MVVKGFHVSNEIQSDKDFCAIVHFMCSLNYIYGIILFKGLSKKGRVKHIAVEFVIQLIRDHLWVLN